MEEGSLPGRERGRRNSLGEHPHRVKVEMEQEQPEAGRSSWRVQAQKPYKAFQALSWVQYNIRATYPLLPQEEFGVQVGVGAFQI